MDVFSGLARHSQDAPALVSHDQVRTDGQLLTGIQHGCRKHNETSLPRGATKGLTGESCAEMCTVPVQVDGLYRFGSQGEAEWRPHAQHAPLALIEQLRNCGHPGLILFSAMVEHLSPAQKATIVRRTPLRWLVAIEDLMGALEFLLSAPAITGQVLAVDGGFSC